MVIFIQLKIPRNMKWMLVAFLWNPNQSDYILPVQHDWKYCRLYNMSTFSVSWLNSWKLRWSKGNLFMICSSTNLSSFLSSATESLRAWRWISCVRACAGRSPPTCRRPAGRTNGKQMKRLYERANATFLSG